MRSLVVRAGSDLPDSPHRVESGYHRLGDGVLEKGLWKGQKATGQSRRISSTGDHAFCIALPVTRQNNTMGKLGLSASPVG